MVFSALMKIKPCFCFTKFKIINTFVQCVMFCTQWPFPSLCIQETESEYDNCAVCIEGYKPNDVIRILPCR